MAKIKTEIVKDSQLGDISLRINPRAKYVSIKIQQGKVVLICPTSTSREGAFEFLNKKRQWIEQKQEAFRNKIKFNLSLPIETRLYEILRAGDSPQSNKTAQYITIEQDDTTESVELKTRQVLENVWLAEANELLPRRVEMLARNLGFSYSRLSFRNSCRKWGSCTFDNHIILNYRLMKLPNELIDFIIIHELCHTVHKNHSAQFHSLVNECTCGRERELIKKMKKYSILI
jgi:predicted metal-dependent hydrolase